MEKSLDRKLRILRANPSANEFILADAKDADMAFGIGAPGASPEMHAGEVRMRTLKEYRDLIREMTRQELVDIMLMSASTSEVLTLKERLFDNSPVTPAARANDTSDIWVVRGGKYLADPAQPFRSASIDHIQCGRLECEPQERTAGANLGLYSVTFTNRTQEDLATLEAYREFRLEAERKGFRYFLEVFDPNVPTGLNPEQTGSFVNDSIARCLAGVVGAGRPQFLKIVYRGPRAMEELFRYDPNLVVGILGGSAGTTYDAFKLLAEAKKYGARVALYGRKINGAENQFAFVRFLRLVADQVISPEEAVRAYHAVLEKLGIKPHRPLEKDMELQATATSYGGEKTKTTSVGGVNPDGSTAKAACPATKGGGCGCGCKGKKSDGAGATAGGAKPAVAPKKPLATMSASMTPEVAKATVAAPDVPASFGKMTSEERLAYHRARIAKLLGG
ncbi:MAG TPA: hypothetical protein VNC50_11495 [Planctomycetia bacterium]|nr:hypothetical protein [Planctomycetia bacterium]